MANEEHLLVLEQAIEEGIDVWNDWRRNNPEIKPDLSKATLRGFNLSKGNFEAVNFYKANLSETKLSCTNLSKANLRKAILRSTHLIRANIRDSDLSKARLIRLQALGTHCEGAILTGACIEDWNINSKTNLNNVICDYVYLKFDGITKQFIERRPARGNFAPGDFTRLFQKALETIDLIFRDGIDWRSFTASFQELQAEQRVKIEGEDTQFKVRGIQANDDGSFVIRIDVPAQLDKAEIEKSFRDKYENQLQLMEAQYRAELKTKDDEILTVYRQQSANLWELIKLKASQPIQTTIDVNAHAGSQAMSETYQPKYDLREANIGGIVDTAQSSSHPEFHQHNYSHRNLAEAATEIKQILEQLSRNYPTETLAQKAVVAEKAIEKIESNQTLKERVVGAIKAMGIEALMEAIDHPVANVLRAGIESFRSQID